MSEVLSDQTELIPNIPRKIIGFLEYGRSNGGWNKLLDIGVLKNDVFVLSSSWEEVKVVVRSYNNERSNFLEQEIENLNGKLDKLGELSEKIIETLHRGIAEWLEFENIKTKRDSGVILKTLEKINFAQLPKNQKRVLDNLVRLLDEFILEYEEWKIFKEKNLEKLNEILSGVASGKIELGDRSRKSLKSAPFDPGKISRRVRSDKGWGWNRNRS